jgi:hypothetical protein
LCVLWFAYKAMTTKSLRKVSYSFSWLLRSLSASTS